MVNPFGIFVNTEAYLATNLDVLAIDAALVLVNCDGSAKGYSQSRNHHTSDTKHHQLHCLRLNI
jgi:hypothetical protein